jgi:hypothetical protein
MSDISVSLDNAVLLHILRIYKSKEEDYYYQFYLRYNDDQVNIKIRRGSDRLSFVVNFQASNLARSAPRSQDGGTSRGLPIQIRRDIP